MDGTIAMRASWRRMVLGEGIRVISGVWMGKAMEWSREEHRQVEQSGKTFPERRITRMNAEGAPKDLGTAPGDRLLERKLTESIIGAFYEVYNTLGSGLL